MKNMNFANNINLATQLTNMDNLLPTQPHKTSMAPKTPGQKSPISRRTSSQVQTGRSTDPLQPEQYARAVQEYSVLSTGVGVNYTSLGNFLAASPAKSSTHSQSEDLVTLYPLGCEESSANLVNSSQKSPGPDADHDSADERGHESRGPIAFHDPVEFYETDLSHPQPESCIIFMRGFMSATWINHIGARHVVDPEFFRRHLHFRPTDDDSNNFSSPALPSSSWHLIELPVFTIGVRKSNMQTDEVEGLRKAGKEALERHHRDIAKLSSTRMVVGEPMIRDFHVLDETHFVIEQRISICVQTSEAKDRFSALVWLDAGSGTPLPPWSIQATGFRPLSVIQNKPMIALKSHRFKCPNATQPSTTTPQAHTVARLPTDYGRSLHPEIMSRDAFYSLSEVFSFAASSQMQFLNLIDVKLDKYTELPSEQALTSLQNLDKTRQILYRHIQKSQRIIDSLDNTKLHKWPRDDSERGRQRAAATAHSLDQDFKHLLNFTTALHHRTTEAITVRMSSISIAESQKAIVQAERVSKLTFLAFVFVPLSFTTSFFGMNVSELEGSTLGLKWWVVMSAIVMGTAYTVLYLNYLIPVKRLWSVITGWWTRGA